MTLAYFCLSSLALLPASAISTAPEDSERSALELMIKDDVKMEFIDWVYDRQELSGGFRGGSSMDKLDLAPKDSAQEGGGTLNDLFSGGAGFVEFPCVDKNPSRHLISIYPNDRSIPGLIPLSEDEELEYQQLMAFPSSPTSSSAPSLLFPTTVSQFSPPNLIQSYTALLVLGLLGDDFKRLNKSGLIRFIARCQNDDGS
jgi:geranylgeranyl transferase type-1 subunit beta